jgi:hypothetical protein
MVCTWTIFRDEMARVRTFLFFIVLLYEVFEISLVYPTIQKVYNNLPPLLFKHHNKEKMNLESGL